LNHSQTIIPNELYFPKIESNGPKAHNQLLNLLVCDAKFLPSNTSLSESLMKNSTCGANLLKIISSIYFKLNNNKMFHSKIKDKCATEGNSGVKNRH